MRSASNPKPKPKPNPIPNPNPNPNPNQERLSGHKHGGVLYCTYSWLSSKRSKKHQGKEGAPKKHSFDSRLEQLLQWRAPPHLRCCLILPRTNPGPYPEP